MRQATTPAAPLRRCRGCPLLAGAGAQRAAEALSSPRNQEVGRQRVSAPSFPPLGAPGGHQPLPRPLPGGPLPLPPSPLPPPSRPPPTLQPRPPPRPLPPPGFLSAWAEIRAPRVRSSSMAGGALQARTRPACMGATTRRTCPPARCRPPQLPALQRTCFGGLVLHFVDDFVRHSDVLYRVAAYVHLGHAPESIAILRPSSRPRPAAASTSRRRPPGARPAATPWHRCPPPSRPLPGSSTSGAASPVGWVRRRPPGAAG
jgi:hypothetical protein